MQPDRPPRRGLPRWLVVTGIVMLVAWLLFLTFAVLASREPAVVAQYLVFGNVNELFAIATFVAAYFIVRRREQSTARRLSYLAVFTALAVILNPSMLHMAFHAISLPFDGARRQ